VVPNGVGLVPIDDLYWLLDYWMCVVLVFCGSCAVTRYSVDSNNRQMIAL
jgi:hypothetical protein